MKCPVFSIVFLLGMGLPASAAAFPKPVEAEAVLKDFQFNTKETLDVRMHYLTVGKPERDKAGKISNAVLILHATTGSISQFMGNGFAGELFGKGQPLDGFYLIIPDSIGHGKSSKPSDGLHAKFPRYNYADM